MGREPGGCGLAATLQLVARDLVPPASRSDEGEDILLDTHTRAHASSWARLWEVAAGWSARDRAAAVTARAAGSPRSAQLGTGGRRTQRGKIAAALTVALLKASRATKLADIVTADARGSAPRVRDPVLHPCLCRERRMRTSSRIAPAVPLATRTRTPATAPDVSAPRERALPHLAPVSQGSARNAP